MNIIKTIYSVFYPHKCTFCRSPIDYTNNSYICKSCMSSLPFIRGKRCQKCGIPLGDYALPVCGTCRKYSHLFSQSFTPLVYENSVRNAIISMKFHDRDFYCRTFAFLITNRIAEDLFPDIDFVTYVPLSKESFKKRGFNQSELIATECAKILNLPLVDAITRKDGTPRQSSLPLSLRRKNAKAAFQAKNISLSGTALLIDDVYTTGSTMNAVSSLLLKMGCQKVCIAAVALRLRS